MMTTPNSKTYISASELSGKQQLPLHKVGDDEFPVYMLSDALGNLVNADNPNIVAAKLIDDSGSAYGVKHTDNKIRVSSVPYTYDIAEGYLPGHSSVRKFGHNGSVDASLEEVWDGSAVYSYPTSALSMSVVSASSNDSGTLVSSGTATGGGVTTIIDTGADFVSDGVAIGDLLINDTNEAHGVITSVAATQLTVVNSMGTANASGDTYRIANASGSGAAVTRTQGLDSSWSEVTQYSILDGTTPVVLPTAMIRCYRSKVVLAGSRTGNAGQLTFASGGTTYAAIIAGLNQTEMALWTVPDGKTAFLTSFYASTSSSKATKIHLVVHPFGEADQTKRILTIYAGTSRYRYDFPLKVVSRSDISILASASGGGGEVSAGFDLWFE